MKRKYSQITSYDIELIYNDSILIKTNISHDGYHFKCNGFSEEDMFLGGQWQNFIRECCNEIYLKYNSKSKEDSKLSLDDLCEIKEFQIFD